MGHRLGGELDLIYALKLKPYFAERAVRTHRVLFFISSKLIRGETECTDGEDNLGNQVEILEP